MPITLVAQLYMVTGRTRGRAMIRERVCCLLSGGGYLYVSDQLGILSLSEQPEGEGSSEASIMAESQDKVGLRAGPANRTTV